MEKCLRCQADVGFVFPGAEGRLPRAGKFIFLLAENSVPVGVRVCGGALPRLGLWSQSEAPLGPRSATLSNAVEGRAPGARSGVPAGSSLLSCCSRSCCCCVPRVRSRSCIPCAERLSVRPQRACVRQDR